MRSSLHHIAIAACFLLLGGCWGISTYPFYRTQDIVTQKDPLSGAWLCSDDEKQKDFDQSWTIKKLPNGHYRATDADQSHWLLVLFHLKGAGHFIDYVQLNKQGDGYLESGPINDRPFHDVMKVDFGNGTFKTKMFGIGEWLSARLKSHPNELKHIVNYKPGSNSERLTGAGELFITAETADLQAFLIKHHNNPKAFLPGLECKRK